MRKFFSKRTVALLLPFLLCGCVGISYTNGSLPPRNPFIGGIDIYDLTSSETYTHSETGEVCSHRPLVVYFWADVVTKAEDAQNGFSVDAMTFECRKMSDNSVVPGIDARALISGIDDAAKNNYLTAHLTSTDSSNINLDDKLWVCPNSSVVNTIQSTRASNPGDHILCSLTLLPGIRVNNPTDQSQVTHSTMATTIPFNVEPEDRFDATNDPDGVYNASDDPPTITSLFPAIGTGILTSDGLPLATPCSAATTACGTDGQITYPTPFPPHGTVIATFSEPLARLLPWMIYTPQPAQPVEGYLLNGSNEPFEHGVDSEARLIAKGGWPMNTLVEIQLYSESPNLFERASSSNDVIQSTDFYALNYPATQDVTGAPLITVTPDNSNPVADAYLSGLYSLQFPAPTNAPQNYTLQPVSVTFRTSRVRLSNEWDRIATNNLNLAVSGKAVTGGSASENVLAVEFYIDSLGSIPKSVVAPNIVDGSFTATINLTGVADGTHVLYAKGISADGNAGYDAISFKLDTKGPDIISLMTDNIFCFYELPKSISGKFNAAPYESIYTITEDGSAKYVVPNHLGAFSASVMQTSNSFTYYFYDELGNRSPNGITMELDTECDGLSDVYETEHGLNPSLFDYNFDLDGDCLSNIREFQHKTDPSERDTDGDGVPDGCEVQYGESPLTAISHDFDFDGLNANIEYFLGADPRAQDSDNDGMPDGYENGNGLSVVFNDAFEDLDNDGLSNFQEYILNLKVNDADSDSDDMPDGWELVNGMNPSHQDNSGIDSDADGLSDRLEYIRKTDPRDGDSDNDGLNDYEELQNNTNPNIFDSDEDGYSDNIEVYYGSNPNLATSRPYYSTGLLYGEIKLDGITNNQIDNFCVTTVGSNYLVLWNDRRNNGLDVYGRLVTADGIVINEVFTVNTSVTGDQFIEDSQGCDSVAVSSNPNDPRFLVTWTDNSSNSGDIKGRFFNLDGSPIDSNEFLVNQTVSGSQSSPVSYSVNGAFIVAWEDLSQAVNRIKYRVWNLNGSQYVPFNEYSLQHPLPQFNSVNDTLPTASFSEAGTSFLLTWIGLNVSSQYMLMSALISSQGAPPGYLTPKPLNAAQIVSAVSYDSNADFSNRMAFYALGNDKYGISISFYNNSLFPLFNLSTQDPNAPYAQNVKPVTDSIGNKFLIIYKMNNALKGNWIAYLSASNPYSKSPVIFNGSNVINSSTLHSNCSDCLSLGANGSNFLLTYQANIGGSSRIRGVFIEESGALKSGEFTVDATPSGYRDRSRVNSLEGNYLVAWRDYRPGANGLYIRLIRQNNSLLEDSDSDGLTDIEEFSYGTELLYLDSEPDGMPDLWEVENGVNPLVFDSGNDNDGDGLSNLEEYNLHTHPLKIDTDGDYIDDAWEITNQTNPIVDDRAGDLDSDGLSNYEEYQLSTDPRNVDTDGDGMNDKFEAIHSLNPTDASDSSLDNDLDDLTNLQESLYATDPNDSDSDNDCMPDGYEVDNGLNPSYSDDWNADLDGDSVLNHDEYLSDTDPQNSDSDADEVSDFQEIAVFNSDPNESDPDGDGIPDKYETAYSCMHPRYFDSSANYDSDLLDNYEEYILGTNPCNDDSDNDGYTDDVESNTGVFINIGDTGTDPLNADTDGDTIPDGSERGDCIYGNSINSGSNPLMPDTDSDGLDDPHEILKGSGLCLPDTDSDELPDGWEVASGLNPTDGSDAASADMDGDGVSAIAEYRYGISDHSQDSDGDTLPDYWEIKYSLNPASVAGDNGAFGDPDSDGLTNENECRLIDGSAPMQCASDSTNPRMKTIRITKPLPNIFTSKPSIQVAGLVDLNVTRVEITANGGAPLSLTPANSSFSGNLSLPTDGAYTIEAKAYHNSTLVGSDSVLITKDSQPPVVAITFPASSPATVKGTPCAIRGSVSDNVSGASKLRVAVNGIAAQVDPANGEWIGYVNVDSSSATHVYAVAIDEAGNTSAPVNIVINMDAVLDPNIPSVTLVAAPDMLTVGDCPSVEFTLAVSTQSQLSGQFSLDFGDETPPETGSISYGSPVTVSHAYTCSTTRIFAPTLTVSDQATGFDYAASTSIKVNNAPAVDAYISGLANPTELAVDASKNRLYVLEDDADRISVYDISGTAPVAVSSITCPNVGDLKAFWPDFDNNTIYLMGENVQAYSWQDSGLHSCSSVINNLTDASGIAVSSEAFYISFSQWDKVSKFDSGGHYIEDITGFDRPSDLLYDGEIYVADTGSNSIKRIAATVEDAFPITGLNSPTYLNITSDGDEYLLTDHGNARVLVLSRDGKVVNNLSSIPDPKGADALDIEDGARVYFVASGNSIRRLVFKEDDTGPRIVWDRFRDAMSDGNLELGESLVFPMSREWYRNLTNSFADDTSQLSEFLPPGVELQPKIVSDFYAEYYMVINADLLDDGPKNYGFLVRFVKSPKGIWYVEQF